MGQTTDVLGQTVMAAAERFCTTTNVSPTRKRLLYEFLSMLGPNNKTLSGLSKPGIEVQPAARADVLYLTRKWMGKHIPKHYYVMRQYEEASGVVLEFLQFLRSEASSLPAGFPAELDEAIEVARQGCEQLPHIMRIMRQPDVLNEAYAFRYRIRPWPLAHVPSTTAVKETSSRCWPKDNEQHYHAWLSFASERCRAEPDELQEVLNQVPVNLSIVNKTDGCWEVLRVQPDHKIVFREWQGSEQISVQFSARRAADFIPGMVMCATVVTLSDGTRFLTDWGYVYPTFYTPYLHGKEDFGPYDPVDLVFSH